VLLKDQAWQAREGLCGRMGMFRLPRHQCVCRDDQTSHTAGGAAHKLDLFPPKEAELLRLPSRVRRALTRRFLPTSKPGGVKPWRRLPRAASPKVSMGTDREIREWRREPECSRPGLLPAEARTRPRAS
jgi:hypothetical protein